MNGLSEAAKWLYVYLTDFVINVSNLFYLSYYEVNFIIFIVLYPLLFAGILILFLYQKKRLRHWQKLS